MKYSKAKWLDAVKKAVKDLNTSAATSGKVCAIATIRYIRDGMVDDIVGDKPIAQYTDEDNAMIATVKETINELIQQVSKEGAENGFASNASAAAKAAGFKTTAESVAEITE